MRWSLFLVTIMLVIVSTGCRTAGNITCILPSCSQNTSQQKPVFVSFTQPQHNPKENDKNRTWWDSIHIGVFAPVSAKIETIDPLIQTGISLFHVYDSGTGMGEISLNAGFGEQGDFQDNVYFAGYKYIHFANDKRVDPSLGYRREWKDRKILNHVGFIFGGSLACEHIRIRWEDPLTGDKHAENDLYWAVFIHAGIGYWHDNFTIRAEFIALLGSENVTSALSLTVGIPF